MYMQYQVTPGILSNYIGNSITCPFIIFHRTLLMSVNEISSTIKVVSQYFKEILNILQTELSHDLKEICVISHRPAMYLFVENQLPTLAKIFLGWATSQLVQYEHYLCKKAFSNS